MAMEQAARAANSFFTTMRTQPIVLALIIVVGILLTYIFYIQARQLQTRDNNLAQLFDAQKTIFAHWGDVFQNQNGTMEGILQQQGLLIDKMAHCLAPDDVVKLLQTPVPLPTPKPQP